MASINVFGSPTSTEASRVLTCLFEKEAEFQLIRIDLYNGLKRVPDPLKLQAINSLCIHDIHNIYALLTFEDGGTTLVGEIH
ncbi:hypothetical protein QJS10_CPB15g00335 [Acorus calamus]|uniref:Uncharacterized protein n=1 Tax=Acorus calamus TaxID=4465 RepID=A0AAV9D4C0_ACOCL|nr:hypothetical protein QJS10_CPB15g00335 [Acorus calamus]